MRSASEANGQQADSHGDASATQSHAAPRTSHSVLNWLRQHVTRAIKSVEHRVYGIGPPIRAQRPALFFLAGAGVSLAIAYPFYALATGAPDVSLRGFVLVLTDDPKISLKVKLEYGRYGETWKDSSGQIWERWEIPDVGDDEIKSLRLSLSQTGKKDLRSHRYLLILGGDARLRNVALHKSLKAQSRDQALVLVPNISGFQSDIDTYEGTIPDDGDQLQISGDLTRPVTDTAAGKTFVRIPTLGTIAESSVSVYRDANKSIPLGEEVSVSGERWFSPKSVGYVAVIGSLPVGTSIDEERPLIDAKDPLNVKWSGTELLSPQARISDNTAEQNSQKKIFLAGVLAGIGGGFFVEGLSRLRPLRQHRPKEQTATTHIE